jgi:dTDP-4-dehydrorhamnose reductase
LTIKLGSDAYDFLIIGFGPITDALSKKLIQEDLSVAIVSENIKSKVGIPVLSRSQVMAQAQKIKVDTVVVSTRLDKWKSREEYEKFMRSMATIKPRRILLLSSVSVYGDSKIPRKESDPTESVTRYGQSKILEEEFLIKIRPEQCELVILRISNVFGNILFDDFVNHVLLSVKSGTHVRLAHEGKATRNFIWIEDLISILLELLSKEKLPEIINIGSASSISLKKLIFEIESITNQNITVIESTDGKDIINNSIIDTNLMNQLVVYKPNEIRSVLEDYYLENPEFRNSK